MATTKKPPVHFILNGHTACGDVGPQVKAATHQMDLTTCVICRVTLDLYDGPPKAQSAFGAGERYSYSREFGQGMTLWFDEAVHLLRRVGKGGR